MDGEDGRDKDPEAGRRTGTESLRLIATRADSAHAGTLRRFGLKVVQKCPSTGSLHSCRRENRAMARAAKSSAECMRDSRAHVDML